jgi:chemotaxis family two-component system sensor kinase Cph1
MPRHTAQPRPEAAPLLLAPGVAVDLDNCALEPIHIPGSIQPRGYLLALNELDLTVQHVSANTVELSGADALTLLGGSLADALGAQPAAVIEHAVTNFSDLRARNPLDVTIRVGTEAIEFDAILNRLENGLLLVELEPANGPRPFSFPNTYQAVRGTVTELNQAASLGELYDITARAVRELTGFDRVMVYRYDEDYNGEVVAEAKRDDLNPFLGLHYPASDIPAQARALYEKNWIRLISDVSYTPVPIVPTLGPANGQPLDLTYSTLRSVSPIHIEYLQNMGVGASMSISLLRHGALWGLIACHHYSGAHTPPYGVRAAAEFLGSTLSLRLVDRTEDDELRAAVQAQSVVAKLAAATTNASEPITSSLLGGPSLLDLVPADGVVIRAEGHTATAGVVPDPASVRAIVQWARSTGSEVASTDSLTVAAPGFSVPVEVASGVLVLPLPEDQFVMWVRAESRQAVDWGGDPHNKELAAGEDDTLRLSPRKSFERWREVVQFRSEPWTTAQRSLAADLRGLVVEALYSRAQRDLRLAETLHRSLLPALPVVAGWDVSAHYETAEGGRVGGDWYDAFRTSPDVLAVVLGDVAGHGITSAGIMAKLSNALRAYLLDSQSPAHALTSLSKFVTQLVPDSFATVFVACINTDTGAVQAASAGHPLPYVTAPDTTPEPAPVVVSPPLGVRGASYTLSEFTLTRDAGLVLFSDGLIERRTEDIDVGLGRLVTTLTRLGSTVSAAQVFADVAQPAAADDATVFAIHRTPSESH